MAWAAPHPPATESGRHEAGSAVDSLSLTAFRYVQLTILNSAAPALPRYMQKIKNGLTCAHGIRKTRTH